MPRAPANVVFDDAPIAACAYGLKRPGSTCECPLELSPAVEGRRGPKVATPLAAAARTGAARVVATPARRPHLEGLVAGLMRSTFG